MTQPPESAGTHASGVLSEARQRRAYRFHNFLNEDGNPEWAGLPFCLQASGKLLVHAWGVFVAGFLAGTRQDHNFLILACSVPGDS
jgi:hypothetical protein